MEKFTQLHLHTNYSIYDGMNTPAQMVAQAVKHGHAACAVTEHGNLSSTFIFQQECEKQGIKPLLGMEGYAVEDLTNEIDGKKVRTPNNHIIMIAKNEEGWKNLLRLNFLSNQDDGHFYYKPRFTFDELFEHKDGLVISSACLASITARAIIAGDEEKAKKYFDKFLETFKDDFYAEVQLNEIADQKKYDDWLIDYANKKGVPIVLTGDCHYAEPDGAIVQKVAFAIRSSDENEVGQEFGAKSLYYHGINDYLNFNKDFGFDYEESKILEWCDNTNLVAEKVNYRIPKRFKTLLPRQAFDEFKTLEERAKNGLAKHFNCEYKDCPQNYKERLEMELLLMWRKGMARYLLCLEDITDWCSENNISRGVGRGSACSSLVLTCLGITQWAIDPIKQNLLFERFVSKERLPDCMIDYEEQN